MTVAIASFRAMPPEFTDLDLLMERVAVAGIDAELHSWDADLDWSGFDLVVARCPWDYTLRLDEFLAWLDVVDGRVENPAPVIRWNADKRYMGDLADWGLPVVETTFVAPGDPVPELHGEVVVKPTVSAGARETGRFGPAHHDAARSLISTIGELGKTAMVQPFLDAVDSAGETALVMIDGELSHVLHKKAVLRADEVAPIRDDGLAAAEAMYDPGLVTLGEATPEQVDLAREVADSVAEHFGSMPLCMRVDLLRGPDGGPVVLELEAIEPNLYLDQTPDPARAADRLVAGISRRL